MLGNPSPRSCYRIRYILTLASPLLIVPGSEAHRNSDNCFTSQTSPCSTCPIPDPFNHHLDNLYARPATGSSPRKTWVDSMTPPFFVSLSGQGYCLSTKSREAELMQ